ncbi:MAG: GNAT family N-acetyltransferase [bacterium]
MSADWPAFSSDPFLSVLRDVYFPGAPAATVECDGLRVRGLLNGRSKLVSGFWPFPFYLEPLREFDAAALSVPFVENVVLATGEVTAPGPAGAMPAPYVDWRTVESWEAYVATRTASPGIDSPGTVERKTRRLERELGALVFQRDDPDPAVFEAVIEWKRRQYRRTGLFDLFSVERNRAFYDELRRRDMCTVSSLRAGGKLVAGSIGNVIGGRFLGRMPAYDPAFGTYSPGSILNLLMLKASLAAGDLEYDFLIGAERYKYTYATHVRWVGSVGREPAQAKISRIVRDKIGPTVPYRAVRTTASRVARRLPGGSARNQARSCE